MAIDLTVVNPSEHNFVVVVEGKAFGFKFFHQLAIFIEGLTAGQDQSKVFNAIATAMSDDKEDDFQIYPIDIYVDLFMDEEEDATDDQE